MARSIVIYQVKLSVPFLIIKLVLVFAYNSYALNSECKQIYEVQFELPKVDLTHTNNYLYNYNLTEKDSIQLSIWEALEKGDEYRAQEMRKKLEAELMSGTTVKYFKSLSKQKQSSQPISIFRMNNGIRTLWRSSFRISDGVERILGAYAVDKIYQVNTIPALVLRKKSGKKMIVQYWWENVIAEFDINLKVAIYETGTVSQGLIDHYFLYDLIGEVDGHQKILSENLRIIGIDLEKSFVSKNVNPYILSRNWISRFNSRKPSDRILEKLKTVTIKELEEQVQPFVKNLDEWNSFISRRNFYRKFFLGLDPE